MEAVFQLVDEGAAKLAAHPLLTCVQDAAVPLDPPLPRLPAWALFAMGSRDICTLVLPSRPPQDPLRCAINEHAAEDATHSRLFLEDWDALGLDERLGWRASDVLWWLFLAPETAAMRHVGMRLLAMPAADGGDPLLRCAWAEVIEAAGAVFFRAIAPHAEQLAGRTGREYRYLGDYHLARESGHIDSVEAFRAQRLGETQRARAMSLALSTLEMFQCLFDCML